MRKSSIALLFAGTLFASACAGQSTPVPSGVEGQPPLPSSPKSPGMAASWPLWADMGLDSARNSDDTFEQTLNTGNVGSLQDLWSVGPGGVIGAVEAKGTIYEVTGGASQQLLTAIDATSGVQVWQANDNVGGAAQGIATNGKLVFVNCSLSYKIWQLCAYKAKNGKIAWTFGVQREGAQAIGSPRYANGYVYLIYTPGTYGYSTPYYIEALNASSGAVAWSAGVSPTDPSGDLAVGDGMVYEASVNNNVIYMCAFSASSGTLVWCDPVSSGSGFGAFNPSVNRKGNVLYVSANDENSANFDLLAFNASTGAGLWADYIANPNGSNGGIAVPTIDDKDNSYWTIGCDGCAATGIYGYDQDGKQLWFDQYLNTQGCQPTVANGVLYTCAGGNGGPAYGLNAASGVALWSSSSTGPSFGASPVVLNGTVYAANWTLNAYGLTSKSKRGRRQR
jgi:hypothetical protein